MKNQNIGIKSLKSLKTICFVLKAITFTTKIKNSSIDACCLRIQNCFQTNKNQQEAVIRITLMYDTPMSNKKH